MCIYIYIYIGIYTEGLQLIVLGQTVDSIATVDANAD